MRARHYDPNSGRFLQEDPIGTKDDINLYRYVANNPMKYVDRFGLEKILIMYSPDHWYNSFSMKTMADTVREMALAENKNNQVQVTSIETAEEFNAAITDFNNSLGSKKGQIVYVGHNKGWLSKNLNNKIISQLPTLKSDIEMSLLACNTVKNDGDRSTDSNQIAQKLANQLNIPVSGSTEIINVYSKGKTFQIQENSWFTLNPGGVVQNQESYLTKVINKLF